MTRRALVGWAFVAGDTVALLAGIYAAAIWSSPTWTLAPRGFLSLRFDLQEIAVGLAVVACWLLVFRQFGMYRERYMSFLRFRPYHLWDLLKASSFGTLLLVGVAFFVDRPRYVGASVMLAFWGANIVATLAVREGLIGLLRQMRLHGRNLRHLLIVGTNPRALAVAEMVRSKPELGYALRGFVDDQWQGRPAAGELVANLDTIAEYLKNHVVDEVLIALPIATLYEKAARVVKTCENHGIVVHFVPGLGFLNAGSSQATINILNDEPIVTLLPAPMEGWQLAVKRLIDIAGAAAGLVLLSPVIIGVAVAIKATSEGPVLFAQERIGLNKRVFRMLKFRTMVKDAEKLRQSLQHLNEASGPVFKIERDPRITRVGAFLRRTSLDELPQLLNVLWGDMSLVGPRPLPLIDYAGFETEWHRRRCSVRPGMTCLWQVRGRSLLSFDKWMELDMEYINHWSVWLDLRILAETVRVVMAQRGAV
jgi:exopolysaccharide biosynthesis polyprenyl glycosylphosphotransferase